MYLKLWKMELPEAEVQIILEIFDLSGRKLATLMEGLAGAGEQTCSIDGIGLTNGMYFLRCTVEGKNTVTQRFVYLK